MIGDQRCIGVIVARGGSKGLPAKNVRPLVGKPLVAWTLGAAAGSRLLDRTIVSTDDPHIADVCRENGGDVPFLRPAHLATDDARVEDALLHALLEIGVEDGYVVLLQATSPLRLASDIDGALRTCHDSEAPTCVSVCPSPKSPFWAMTLDDHSAVLTPLIARDGLLKGRQALPATFTPNGAVYVARIPWLREHRRLYDAGTVGWVMPPERSIDIDTLLDFKLVEAILASSDTEPQRP